MGKSWKDLYLEMRKRAEQAEAEIKRLAAVEEAYEELSKEYKDNKADLEQAEAEVERLLEPLSLPAELRKERALADQLAEVLQQYAEREDIGHIAGVVDALAAWEEARKQDPHSEAWGDVGGTF